MFQMSEPKRSSGALGVFARVFNARRFGRPFSGYGFYPTYFTTLPIAEPPGPASGAFRSVEHPHPAVIDKPGEYPSGALSRETPLPQDLSAPRYGTVVNKVDLEVLFHIHTIVQNSDHNDLGFRASSVKDDMAALTELFVSRLYVIRIAAHFRLARKQLEGIIKLLKVLIALPLSPFSGGKPANIHDVFPGGSGEQVWKH